MLVLQFHVLIKILTGISLALVVIASSEYGKDVLNVLDFGAVGNGLNDDSHAFLEAWRALCCSGRDYPTLYIPEDREYLLIPLTFQGPCRSKRLCIQVEGNIVAPSRVESWEEWNNGNGRWLYFNEVEGLLINGTGTFNGHGSAWWSTKRSAMAPNGLYFHRCDRLRLNGFRFVNSPRMHIVTHTCTDVGMYNLHISAPSYSPNTDGIDITKSTHVNIYHVSIGSGDDCIAIKDGSSYINITSVTCGPGHGISVGSLGINGANNTVEEVHVRNCSFIGSKNCARIKTWKGAGFGYAKAISFEHITISSSKNPIIIDQNYCNPKKQKCNSLKSRLKVSDVTFRSFRGTSINKQAITLNCSTLGCTNILMDNIQLYPAQPGVQLRSFCENAHGKSYFTQPNVPCLSP